MIGDHEAFGWILTEGRTAFASTGKAEVAALAKGDELFLYTTRGSFRNAKRDRARVIGTATVTTPVARLDEPVRFGDREFPVGCDPRIGPLAPFGQGVELQPLVEQLDAFGRTTHAWSIQLRRPIQIPDGDAYLLRGRIATTETTDAAEDYTRWWRAGVR